MSISISSPQNPKIKAAMKLRDRKHREREGRFLIDGLRETERAIAGGIEIEEAFIKSGDEQNEALAAIAGHLHAAGITTYLATAAAFERITFGDRDEGVVAVGKIPAVSLDALKLPALPLVVVLENVEKPGNLGAVLRTADAAGASAIIAAGIGVDLFNPNVVRASLGAIFSVPVSGAASKETLDWLRSNRLQIFAARVDASHEYTEVSYSGPSAIVLGSEADGLSGVWNGPDITPISLPMLGVVDSLNVSTSAAIVLYEAVRQRRLTHRPST